MDKVTPDNCIDIIKELGGKKNLTQIQDNRFKEALLFEKLSCDLQYED